MRIFISWSGERSRALAIALRDWLPDVLQFADPWLSESDIDAGERWSGRVAEELEATNFGILCVTRDNMNAPWLLFEAGALAKSIQTGRVVPLLLDLDVRDISGPLAQFQAKKADESGITDLVTSLNKLAEKPLPDGRIEKALTKFLGELCETIRSIPATAPASASKPTRGDDEVLDELLTLVRGIDGHIKGMTQPKSNTSEELESEPQQQNTKESDKAIMKFRGKYYRRVYDEKGNPYWELVKPDGRLI